MRGKIRQVAESYRPRAEGRAERDQRIELVQLVLGEHDVGRFGVRSGVLGVPRPGERGADALLMEVPRERELRQRAADLFGGGLQAVADGHRPLELPRREQPLPERIRLVVLAYDADEILGR